MCSEDNTNPQPRHEGCRRQKRGRVVRALSEFEELTLEEPGPRVRVYYSGEYGEEWLRELVADLETTGWWRSTKTQTNP